MAEAGHPLPGRVFLQEMSREGSCPGFVGGWVHLGRGPVFGVQPLGQIADDVRRAVVTEQSRFVRDSRDFTSGCNKRIFRRVGHVPRLYRRAKPPCHYIPAVIVQDRAQIIPAPAVTLR